MNIYVSNLNFRTSSESMQELFAQYGEVASANVIMDRETGRSRGFGFVEMPDDAQGQSAIDALNGIEFDGKTLTVNVARPKEDRPRGGGGGGFSRGGGGGYNRGGGDGYNRGGGDYNKRRY